VACGGPSTSIAEHPLAPGFRADLVARRPFVTHVDHSHTWISPELAKAKVTSLFVSDAGTADVYIYKLPGLKVLAKITGFAQPQGECADQKGNVWIADTNARMVYELSHHGQLQDEIKDSTGYPVSCAWDPKNNNLAVMDMFGTSGIAGDVLVYAGGKGTPAIYTNPSQYYYNFGGYDPTGNLFFDGRDFNGDFMLSELPSGAATAETVSVPSNTIYFPGMVEWDSKRRKLVVGDQSCGNLYASCLYTIAISGQIGTIKSQIPLQDSSGAQICDMVQGAIYGSQIAGSDLNFCGGVNSTYLWPYPGGGAANDFNATIDSEPVGAAISR
jgi:hypothetical protein